MAHAPRSTAPSPPRALACGCTRLQLPVLDGLQPADCLKWPTSGRLPQTRGPACICSVVAACSCLHDMMSTADRLPQHTRRMPLTHMPSPSPRRRSNGRSGTSSTQTPGSGPSVRPSGSRPPATMFLHQLPLLLLRLFCIFHFLVLCLSSSSSLLSSASLLPPPLLSALSSPLPVPSRLDLLLLPPSTSCLGVRTDTAVYSSVYGRVHTDKYTDEYTFQKLHSASCLMPVHAAAQHLLTIHSQRRSGPLFGPDRLER